MNGNVATARNPACTYARMHARVIINFSISARMHNGEKSY